MAYVYSTNMNRVVASVASGAVLGAVGSSIAAHASAEDESDFDLYVENPRVEDLRPLVRSWEKGAETWPWVWTWRNQHGPHHVFVGLDGDAVNDIERLSHDARNNITIVAPESELRAHAPGGDQSFYSRCQCGHIASQVALMDVKAKIMMLEDERIICFDRCTVSQPPEPGAPGDARAWDAAINNNDG